MLDEVFVLEFVVYESGALKVGAIAVTVAGFPSSGLNNCAASHELSYTLHIEPSVHKDRFRGRCGLRSSVWQHLCGVLI